MRSKDLHFSWRREDRARLEAATTESFRTGGDGPLCSISPTLRPSQDPRGGPGGCQEAAVPVVEAQGICHPIEEERVTLSAGEQRRVVVLNHLEKRAVTFGRRPGCWGSRCGR